MYFVYILVCLQSRRTYVGHTDHLLRRYRLHCAGSTRTTRERLVRPVIAYWELCPTRAAAMEREKYFKAGAGHRKKQLIVDQSIALFDEID